MGEDTQRICIHHGYELVVHFLDGCMDGDVVAEVLNSPSPRSNVRYFPHGPRGYCCLIIGLAIVMVVLRAALGSEACY